MLVPQGVLFNLKEIEDMKIIKIDMDKKLIYNNKLEVGGFLKSIELQYLSAKMFLDKLYQRKFS